MLLQIPPSLSLSRSSKPRQISRTGGVKSAGALVGLAPWYRYRSSAVVNTLCTSTPIPFQHAPPTSSRKNVLYSGEAYPALCDLVRITPEKLFGEGKLLIVGRLQIASDSIQALGEFTVEGFQMFLATGDNAEHPGTCEPE